MNCINYCYCFVVVVYQIVRICDVYQRYFCTFRPNSIIIILLLLFIAISYYHHDTYRLLVGYGNICTSSGAE